MSMNMISAVVLAKNEEGEIEECLQTLTWCDEILVIDDCSHDKTSLIAKKLGAKVYRRELGEDFAAQRNFGLRKAKYEWVLFVDADERVSSELAMEMKGNVMDKQFAGFGVQRHDEWMGKPLKGGEWGGMRLVRLAKKGAGRWERRIHEEWKVQGIVRELNNILVHRVHNSLGERIDKIGRYSKIHAKEKKDGGFWRVVMMPMAKFGVNYFVKMGWRDGVHGFVMAMVMSLHSFLAWSAVWVRKS